MMRRIGAVAVVFSVSVAVAAGVSAQESGGIGISVTPEVLFDVGDKADNYRPGLGARIDALLGIPGTDLITPSLEAAYAFVPLDLGQSGLAADTNLGLLRGGLAAEYAYPLGERFTVTARAHGGGYFGFLQGDETGSDGGFAVGGGAGFGVLLTPRVLVELSSAYEGYLGLYDAVSVSLRVTTRLAGRGTRSIPRSDFAPTGPGALPAEGYIRFMSVQLDRVFPVLYKYYDDHPIGRAVVRNEGSRTVEDVEIRFALQQYMDVPKISARIEELEPGAEQEIDLYALFTEEILGATEGAKVAAEISARYAVGNRSGTDSDVVTLDTYERNALRWDDDRKIAAFVTARDDEVQRFARNVASIIDDAGVEAVDRELQLAIGFFSALHQHRCAYVVDPSSAYAEISQDSGVVDSVQFPRQTLQFRAGDCDDLSATYNALLEAVGVETAFITVPGHIYAAFQLNMGVAEATRTFSRPDDIILRDDEVWVPVETTLLGDGFLAAWAEGARAWREHDADGAAGFFATRESWQIYEPVAFSVAEYQVDIPLRDDLVRAFDTELNRFVSREIADQEAPLLARLERRPGDERTLNRLGVLYARYGRFDEARDRFRAANGGGGYVPALVNLGNIAFLQEDYAEARSAWDRALREEPDNEAALLGIARLDFAREDYGAAEEAHTRLARLDPDLADRYSYLGTGEVSTGRAADVTQRRLDVVWED